MARFAHISDPHVGKSDAEAPLFEQWLAKLEEHDFDVLVVSGDLVDKADAASLSWVCRQLESFSRPYVVVPGNHDVVIPGEDEVFREYFGEFPRVERHAGMTFALFDSFNRLPLADRVPADMAMFDETGFFADGRIGEKQLAEVAGQLAASDDRRVAVVHHFLFAEANRHDLRPLHDAEEFLAWCEEHGFRHVCVGHLHKPAELRVERGVTRFRPGRCTKAPFGSVVVDVETGDVESVTLW